MEEAKAYGSAIKKFVNDNAESLKTIASGNSTVESLVNGIINLPTSAAATAEDAKAAITSDVVQLASPAIAKGETVVETAKAAAEMVKNAPETVKNAAKSAVKMLPQQPRTPLRLPWTMLLPKPATLLQRERRSWKRKEMPNARRLRKR